MKNITTTLLFLMSLLAALSLSSCMHSMMMGTHASDQHEQAHVEQEQEIIVGAVHARATFPPLEVGKSSVFILKLHDSKTKQPIERAQVVGQVRMDEPTKHHMDHAEHQHDMPMDSVEEKDRVVVFSQDLAEGETRGHYSFRFQPQKRGEYVVSFEVRAIDSQPLNPAVILQSRKSVHERSRDHGMFSGDMMLKYGLIGAVAMGVMMVFMMRWF